jgi:hypothetical protein
MNKNRNTPILTVILFLTTWCATTALGGLSLTNIPCASSDTSNEGRAITQDGKYVGGLSGTANGFFYNVTNDYVTIPLAGSYAAIITGIAYRTDTNQVPAVVQVVLDGNNNGWHGQYETSDGGLTWGYKRRDNTGTTYAFADYPNPGMNSLAATANSDVYYNTFRKLDKTGVYTCRGSNLWTSTTAAQVQIVGKTVSGDTVDLLGVAANGRIVGLRKTSGVSRNTLWDWMPQNTTQWQWNGLDGTTVGQAWSVSLDGNVIFGWSHTLTDAVNNYGYKTVVSGTSPNAVPPGSGITQVGINALPEFSNTGGSTTREVPHGCTADGKYAVGYSYPGVTTAVLWDTSAPNPANWTITDLYALAAANGIPDIFNRLVKAYSVGTNGAGDPVITGYGTDTSANTRAFLMTVPRWIAAIGFPSSFTVNYGTTATFSLVTNGTDSLTYQWYKDGAPLANVGNVSGATSATLTLTSVSCARTDAGNYQVVVSNAPISGVVTGGVATLTVADPFISVQPVSHVCLVGSNTSFTVSAGGAPTVSYQWQRGGSPLSDGDSGFGSTIAGASTAALTISNVTQADGTSGDYTVVLTTSAGGCMTASKSATLTVLDGMPVLNSVEAIGSYTLNVSGPGGQSYKVLYSTNITAPLSSWKPLITNTFSGAIGVDTYTDEAPTNSRRFYIIGSP